LLSTGFVLVARCGVVAAVVRFFLVLVFVAIGSDKERSQETVVRSQNKEQRTV